MSTEGGWSPPTPSPPPPPPPHTTVEKGESPYVIGAAVATGLGGIWAFAITVYVASTDGVAPDQYDAGNRAALGFLMIALLVILPVASLVVYVIARALRVGSLGAVLIAQVTALVAALWIGSSW